MTLISRAYNGLIISLAILGGLMLALIFVGIIADVTVRTIGFNSIQWYSAIAEYCLLFSTMFGAPWLVRLKGHVVVESLTMAMPDMMDVCIVFRPQPGKLAMLYLAKRAKPGALTAEGSPLDSTVDDGIFPLGL